VIHLQQVGLRNIQAERTDQFPFSVPAIRSLQGSPLDLSADVTFFVGENGAGKSTLLEAIACAGRATTVGSEATDRDPTLAAVRTLADRLVLSWKRRSHRGFFLRSEDFFGFTKYVQILREEAQANLREIDQDTERSDYARSLARMPHQRTLHELRERYGEDLDAMSHGESYFKLFAARFVPNGFYLLDEPEGPLSPMRQLGLLSFIKTMVEDQQAQFLIATHSPMLMAYPGALIYRFDQDGISRADYHELDHVAIMRDFLNHPERFLRHL
jgi:predicted ATPase